MADNENAEATRHAGYAKAHEQAELWVKATLHRISERRYKDAETTIGHAVTWITRLRWLEIDPEYDYRVIAGGRDD